MFAWFKPTCPVDAAAKQWIELRLNWLAQQFGRDLFLTRPFILPNKTHFPDPVDGSAASIRRLLEQVCHYMEVSPKRVSLNLFVNKSRLYLVNQEGKSIPNGAAGLYDQRSAKTIIHIETSQLGNLAELVGTMAHELAHLRLMGDGRVTGYEFDNELLTDLTAVYHGFGVFLGNSPRNWDGMYGSWPGTNMKRPEYMTLPMYAYVLGHAAWLRGEPRPSWFPYLSFDLKACFKQGLRFLTKTANSQFAPQSHFVDTES